MHIFLLLNFNSSNGQYPNGDLTFSGNVLYGTTNKGGAHSVGVLFSINTDGSGYNDLVDFDYNKGANPYRAH